jgi:hypothetical protein
MAEQFNLKNWKQTLEKVIPERKVKNEKNDEKIKQKQEKKK